MIPKYRAGKVEDGELVSGNLLRSQGKCYISEDNNSDVYLDSDECFDDGAIDGEIRFFGGAIFEVDPKFLSISFDGGISWFRTFDRIDSILKKSNIEMSSR